MKTALTFAFFQSLGTVPDDSEFEKRMLSASGFAMTDATIHLTHGGEAHHSGPGDLDTFKFSSLVTIHSSLTSALIDIARNQHHDTEQGVLDHQVPW